MLRRINRPSVRSVKTLHTPIYDGRQLATRQYLLNDIAILDNVLNSTSHNKSILYTSKYKRLPLMISGNDSVRVNQFVRELSDSMQLSETLNQQRQRDPAKKLGKIGLQLFMSCHDNNITPLSTSLTCNLMKHYNRYPYKETVEGICESIAQVREIIDQNKIILDEPRDIDKLVDKLAKTTRDAETIKRVLSILDYQLYSDDVVRVVRGRKTYDEVEVAEGWKYPCGVMNTDEAYLRSLELPTNKIVSINKESLVVVFDGTLREADKILPSLHYASKQGKSLVVVVSGECVGDALTAITINNNKNKRQGVDCRTVILRYIEKDHNNTRLEENLDFIQFLKLPRALGSIYSPKFSECVPSSASAPEFYGVIESLKATTGEAFLYNSQEPEEEINNDALRTTLTVKVGGDSEFEIDQRRAELDHIANDVLCHGLADGWVPTLGVALAKSIPYLKISDREDQKRVGTEAVTESLTLPLEHAMSNLFYFNKFKAAQLIGQTITEPEFTTAYLEEPTCMRQAGLLEPWNKVDKCLSNVANFIKLLSSCDVLIAKFFDKPKKK